MLAGLSSFQANTRAPRDLPPPTFQDSACKCHQYATSRPPLCGSRRRCGRATIETRTRSRESVARMPDGCPKLSGSITREARA